MANNNTYTWSFPVLDVTKAQGSYNDVVYTVHWRLKAMDPTTTHSMELYGVQSLPAYNPDSGSFVPFNELTQEIVETWVIGAMGEKYGQLTSSIDNKIYEMINPTTAQLAPPWQS